MNKEPINQFNYELANIDIGWGNVSKKNVYMIDYEYIKKHIEGDSQIYIF